MKGWRTIIANILIGGFAIAAVFGFDVTDAQKADILNGVLALAAVVNIILRFKTDTPVFYHSTQRRYGSKQRGHASISFLVVIMAVAIGGCSMLEKAKESAPWQPFSDCIHVYDITNHALASCSVSIEILANLTDAAADANAIDKVTEDKILDRLQLALETLQSLNALSDTLEAQVAFAKIRQIVADVKTLIPIPE